MHAIQGHRYPTVAPSARVISGVSPGTAITQQPDPLQPGQSGVLSVDMLRRLNVAFPGDRYTMAEEGSYFLASSWTQNPPTLGSCTFVAAQTAFGVNAPNFLIQNNSPTPATGQSYSVCVDFLKMIATASATAATAIYYAAVLDPAGLRTPTTNNMTTAALTNPDGNLALLQNFAPPAAQLPVVRFQSSAVASVLPAASASAFLAARGCLGGLNIVGDEMLIAFGDMGVGAQTATTAAEGAGQPGRRVSCDGPIVIPPGGSCALHIWMPASTASFNPEFEMGLYAR